MGMRDPCMEMLDACSKIVPDKGVISKWRVLLDTALMLHSRQVCSANPGAYARFMMGRKLINVQFAQEDSPNVVVLSTMY